MDKKEKVEKNEKDMKKNYSIIIAIALIAILVVAMICLGASKKNNDNDVPSGNNNNIVNENVNPGEEDIPSMDDFVFPEFEENTERDADGNKVNVSPNIKDGMTFDFLELSNISLKYVDGTTKFNATVMNNSDDEYLLGLELRITFYDNDGREIYETHVLTSAIYARRETAISSNITMDCSYANTFDIEIIKHDM